MESNEPNHPWNNLHWPRRWCCNFCPLPFKYHQKPSCANQSTVKRNFLQTSTSSSAYLIERKHSFTKRTVNYNYGNVRKTHVTRCVALVSVCVDTGQRISLSVLAWNPHRGPQGEISRVTGSGGGKERPREDRESQVTKEGRREQSAWDSCPEKDTVSRRRQWEDGSRAVKAWVSIPCGFVEVSR